MESDIVAVLRKAKIVNSRLESLDRSNISNRRILRQKILSDYKNDLKRRYHTATGEEPSEEEISGGGGVQMFEGKGVVDLKNKERHEVAMDIQRSLKRLHQVFLDMAVLIETRGEKMDDIEEKVTNAGKGII
ncbi:hypothetical protein POTOM_019254 [Populus tomentosa]|uniref:t-SNARE coiled-coil homology domain-containing protein n=1 Tax=Populus tomentosa TaxID=118781 RepID=A0A8X8D2W8_POPTO|nr:hypothetical protein POTOM_019254 [Populus tomentosa]